MRVGDHPRIRGEHRVDRPDVPQAAGSSPHTRGARRGPGPPRGPGRIIPAYAGSTSRKPPRRGRRWDHPRIRGEHLDDVYSVLAVVGSTPHTRGARGRPRVYPISSRINPAYAGSTALASHAMYTPRDQPRIRGEHPQSCRWSSLDVRIIPAYAGSTRQERGAQLGRQDHPRIRGEHRKAFKNARIVVGSSPHTRGARGSGLRAWTP